MADTEAVSAQLTRGARARSKGPCLTGSRLERKRKTDREAQRMARLKTKNYVAHLEELVETLQRSGRDPQLSDLTARLEKTYGENEQLKDALRNIHNVAQLAVGATEMRPISNHSIPAATSTATVAPVTSSASIDVSDMNDEQDLISENTVEVPDRGGHLYSAEDDGLPPVDLLGLDVEYWNGYAAVESLARAPLGPDATQWRSCMPVYDHELKSTDWPLPLDGIHQTFSSVPSNTPNQNPVPLAIVAESIQHNHHSDWKRYLNKDTKLFQFAMETLDKVLELCKDDLWCSREQDDDITIRAVFHGWRATDDFLDPGWQCLRQIDERLFSFLGDVERVAMLRVMRLELRYQVEQMGEALQMLPPFLQIRPFQPEVNHPNVVDFFAWPALRELMLYFPQTYMTDRFSVAFCTQFRFLWPFEPRDVFQHNKYTGRYLISRRFEECSLDLRCWAMTADFHTLFPELAGEISIFNPTPLSLLPTDCRPSLLSVKKTGPKIDLIHEGKDTPATLEVVDS